MNSPYEHGVFVENINQFESERSLGESFRFIATPNGVDLLFKNTGITYIYRAAAKMSEQEREQYEKLGQDELAKLPKP